MNPPRTSAGREAPGASTPPRVPSPTLPVETALEDDEPTIVLDDVVPTRLVSGNRRIHHHVRAPICAYWRKLAHDAAIDAYGWADVGETWHQRVHIVVTFRFPNRQRRDSTNLYQFVAKPLVDGLVDARVVPDDDDLHVQGPDIRRDLERGPHRVTIHVHDLGATP